VIAVVEPRTPMPMPPVMNGPAPQSTAGADHRGLTLLLALAAAVLFLPLLVLPILGRRRY
jgi:hypothetical protein